MNKFEFGTKEIVATFCSVVLIAVIRFLELDLTALGMMAPEVLEWIIPAIPIVTLTAVYFGPVAGMLAGIGGNLLKCALFAVYIDYPEVITLGVYGFFVGMYFGRMHFDPARFNGTKFLDFNAVHIMAGVFCAMFLLPMLRFLIQDANLYECVISGAKYCVGTTIIIGIVCSLILLIVSYVLAKKREDAVLEHQRSL